MNETVKRERPTRPDAKCPGARVSWVESSTHRPGARKKGESVPPRWPDSPPAVAQRTPWRWPTAPRSKSTQLQRPAPEMAGRLLEHRPCRGQGHLQLCVGRAAGSREKTKRMKVTHSREPHSCQELKPLLSVPVSSGSRLVYNCRQEYRLLSC